MKKYLTIIIMICIASLCSKAHAEFITSLQGAAVFSAKNDARLPGDSGTDISFTDDLESETVFSPRIEAGYEFNNRHYAGFMASLLRVEAKGTLERDTDFGGEFFPAGTEATGKFRFDSYRATYRYLFYPDNRFKIGIGATGKIRDADLSLESGSQKGELTNTGFVPLVNFYFEWIISPELSALVYGDALASPYGRAEDVFSGILYRFNENIAAMAGYRILEGGADNDEVYTFSLFHYAVVGVEVKF